jgi:sugar phosphate isomerase/epimerase
MGAKFSLAHLTVLTTPPPAMVELAAACGYDEVGFRLTDVTGGDGYPMPVGSHMLRDTKRSLAATGIEVLDVELVRLTPAFQLEAFRPVFETAAELGAKHVLTQGHDPHWERLVDNYSALCGLAAQYGLTADIEFLTWTGLRTLDDAVQLAMTSGRPNGGVMIDTLHFFRSGCEAADISNFPPDLFHYIQVADAPSEIPNSVEGLIHTAREARLFPGEGGLDIVGVLRHLPKDTSISLEIPNSELARTMQNEQRCRLALDAMKKVLLASERTGSWSSLAEYGHP